MAAKPKAVPATPGVLNPLSVNEPSLAHVTPPTPAGVLTFEELADRLIPEDPQLSPDGRHLVFAVAPRGMTGEHKEQSLWLARGAAPAQSLTSGRWHDANPRWSPSGQQILFCSDRETRGEFKLHLIDLDGGEARPLAELCGELTMPTWSPDGSSIAFLRKDPVTEEEKKRKEDRDDAIVVDQDLKAVRLWVVDPTSGKARCLTYAGRHIWSYAWVPGGDQLVVLTTQTADLNTLFDAGDAWLVPLHGGAARLVHTFRVLPSSPVVVDGPDGPVLAVIANDHRDDPTDSVWTVPLDGGTPQNLLPHHLGVVEALKRWPGSPTGLGARIVEGTHARLYAVDAVTGKLSPQTPTPMETRGTILGGISYSADGCRVAFIWSDGTSPEEVYVGEIGAEATAVTTFGASFTGRLSRVEVVRWASTDGVEVEGLLTYPMRYEKEFRYPLIVEVHGGPASQWEDRVMLDWHDWAQMLASRGYAVLLPNPRGSTGYGSAFQKLLQDDVGGGEAQDLITGATAIIERGIADPDRLGIGGWSWGGFLTAWTITQTTMFKAAVMGAGLANMISDHGTDDIPAMNLWIYPGQPYDYLDEYWKSSPIRYINAVKTPTLILHGDADERVHPTQGMEYHRALKTLGVPVEFVRYPREGHSFRERLHQIDLMDRIVRWYDRWLKTAPCPPL
ncbi:MAG: S9 family peptidase [Chloroflexota bacterium]|nr:S9 family peptidase [Chloroflexota bacterium]